jgi:co-chaperonin GroES (HSP10)
MVDPLVIKINTEKLEVIPIIMLLDEEKENRAEQTIKLEEVSDSNPFDKEIYAIEEEKQDKNNKKKIEFKFNQTEFVGKYGKYNLTYGDNDNIFSIKQFLYMQMI